MREIQGQEYPNYEFKSDRDWHIHFVYNDPKFAADFKSMAASGRLTAGGYQELADKWQITADDVLFYKLGLHRFEPNTDEPVWVHFDEKEQLFTITLTPQTSKETLDRAWSFIQKRKRELKIPDKRRRASDDPQLVYAIFKQRLNKVTFKAIFGLYQQGKLPGYEDGPTNQYSSEDALEAYYREHSPKS